MPGRKYQAGSASYRYSINGQEKDNELNENITTALYWEYDGRVGRRWNVDPKPVIGVSEYAVFLNNPIYRVDILGDSSGIGANSPPTSTKEAALARIKELSSGLQQSTTWKNVNPTDFINDLTSRVNNPSGFNQGDGTNFCWAAACMSYVYEKNPLGMVDAMFSAYTTGIFKYDNGTNILSSVDIPGSNIANEPGRQGSSFNKNAGLTNKSDQMLLLMLGRGFKGYMNVDVQYDPGDQDNITWSNGVLSKAKKLWNSFGYDVNVYGTDLGWSSSNKGGSVMNALNNNHAVVLFINSPLFKRNEWGKNWSGTHYIRVNNMTSVNNMYTVSYWDYGQWHTGKDARTISHNQFWWSTYGMITVPK